MTDLRAYCHQCHHAWTAHDDGTDDGDYCRVCPCDGYVPDFTDEELIELQADLDELEQTDPEVAAAAASYDRMVEKVTGRTLPDRPPPVPSGPRDNTGQEREELAAALAAFDAWLNPQRAAIAADALWPTIDRIATARGITRAQEAVSETADWLSAHGYLTAAWCVNHRAEVDALGQPEGRR